MENQPNTVTNPMTTQGLQPLAYQQGYIVQQQQPSQPYRLPSPIQPEFPVITNNFPVGNVTQSQMMQPRGNDCVLQRNSGGSTALISPQYFPFQVVRPYYSPHRPQPHAAMPYARNYTDQNMEVRTAMTDPQTGAWNRMQQPVYEESPQKGTGTEESAPWTANQQMKQAANVGAASSGSGHKPPCAVCHCPSTGLHYGVYACEGCKSFFHRAHKRAHPYVCPANNNCVIDRRLKKNCPACRLKKCLAMGMSFEEHAVPNRATKKKPKKTKRSPKRAKKSHPDPPAEETPPEQQLIVSPTLPLYNPTVPLISHLVSIEPNPILTGYNPQCTPTEGYLMALVTDLANREIEGLVDWAARLPGYGMLPMDDQVNLIRTVWLDLLMLGLVWRSMEHRGEWLVFAPDLLMDRSLCRLSGMEYICTPMLEFARQFADLQVPQEVYVCLKALTLYTTAVSRLQDYRQVQRLQHEINEALAEACSSTFGFSPGNIARLMMIVSQVRQLSSLGVDHLNRLRGAETVSVEGLLREIVDEPPRITEIEDSPVSAEGNKTTSRSAGRTECAASTSCTAQDEAVENSAEAEAEAAEFAAQLKEVMEGEATTIADVKAMADQMGIEILDLD
ncbi:estrogen receptor beta-like [Branchiostoma floridae]|uniref:Estrogen receptor beta-like n=1 Tax=Branchiostoma floridae TaxID=7739 RepID=A0A9J7M3F2_BRAFL|nr:estrogen receptor beta-like [Branchiostoma floridae]